MKYMVPLRLNTVEIASVAADHPQRSAVHIDLVDFCG